MVVDKNCVIYGSNDHNIYIYIFICNNKWSSGEPIILLDILYYSILLLLLSFYSFMQLDVWTWCHQRYDTQPTNRNGRECPLSIYGQTGSKITKYTESTTILTCTLSCLSIEFNRIHSLQEIERHLGMLSKESLWVTLGDSQENGKKTSASLYKILNLYYLY